MSFQEVQELFFTYEEQRHKIIQDTQKYFLKNKFHPYVWFDENHRLRIKHKYRRGMDCFHIKKERQEFLNVVEEFSKENDLTIRFILDVKDTDRLLSDDIKSQWSTELIFEV